jgi:MFS family permease
MVADLGAVTGPLVAGWLTDAFSYQAAFAVSAGVLGLAVLAALSMPRVVRPVS